MTYSKKQEEETNNAEWQPVGESISYWRTEVQRSGWRIPGPLNMDDEEDDDQVLDDINGVDGSAALATDNINNKKNKVKQPPLAVISASGSPVKKKKRYFYCLTFQVEFDYDDDSVYFAYSTPYSYS